MTVGGLPRYVIAATLARTADGGAVVAIVLLVSTSGAPGWGVSPKWVWRAGLWRRVLLRRGR